VDQINSAKKRGPAKKGSPSQLAAPQAAAGADMVRNLTLNDSPMVDSAMDSDISVLLRNQIEFYFGNSNLAKDRYLRALLDKDEKACPYNCVRIIDLMTFGRIKKIFSERTSPRITINDEAKIYRTNLPYLALSDIQKDQVKWIAKSLKRSKVVKVCKDMFCIKRRVPFKLDKSLMEHIEKCTVYVTGFQTIEKVAETFKGYHVCDIRMTKE